MSSTYDCWYKKGFNTCNCSEREGCALKYNRDIIFFNFSIGYYTRKNGKIEKVKFSKPKIIFTYSWRISLLIIILLIMSFLAGMLS